MFIVIEGNNGSGKSTQIEFIGKWLSDIGYFVKKVKEPGGTPLGEEIRKILLESKSSINAEAQALLFAANRAQLVREVIIPELEANVFVLCDRFVASSIIHQGMVGGMMLSDVITINEIATDNLNPHMTIYLQLSNEEVIARIRERNNDDNFDSQDDDYHTYVNNMYDSYFDTFNDKDNLYIIDASRSVDEVTDQIKTAIMEKLE